MAGDLAKLRKTTAQPPNKPSQGTNHRAPNKKRNPETKDSDAETTPTEQRDKGPI